MLRLCVALLVFLIIVELIELIELIETPVFLIVLVFAALLLPCVEHFAELVDARIVLAEFVTVQLNTAEGGERARRSRSKTSKTLGVDVVELQAQDLELLVLALGKG
ncbi:hypothetical protein HBI07_175870 [Parastagonospora nodorum]|nr:hypothetical protein HBI07_175870 [Parastagonospora nodorum]